jgi:hypothetical protein
MCRSVNRLYWLWQGGNITWIHSVEVMMDAVRTNFVGVLNVTNAVLPHMRNRREGLIVVMGSRSVFRNQTIVSLYAHPVHRILVSYSNLNGSGPRFVICSYLWALQSTDPPGGPQELIQHQKLLSTVSLSSHSLRILLTKTVATQPTQRHCQLRWSPSVSRY